MCMSENVVTISLKDNSFRTLEQAGATVTNASSVYRSLSQIAGIALERMESDNLLLFPQHLSASADEIGKLLILDIEHAYESDEEQLLQKTISTGNLMGFFRLGETQVNITSRFSDSNSEDFFLQYMLCRIFHLNVVSLIHSFERKDFFELYVLLFNGFLKRALKKGLFRLYKTVLHNDLAVKGPIDICRHIKENNPFGGSISYISREYSYDNYVIQLIRHTIDYIERTHRFSYLLSADQEIKQFVQIIKEQTPEFNRKSKKRVVLQNRKTVRHPYFIEYTALQHLCLLILKKEKIGYWDSSRNLSGILFDGAWLWEEYLAELLRGANLGFIHSENRKARNGIEIYHGNICFPDFYRKDDTNEAFSNNCVLDAKYQHLEDGFKPDGLHQLITYMHVLPAKTGALVYPCSNNDKKAESILRKPGFSQYSPKENLRGLGGSACLLSFPVPSVASCDGDIKTFSSRMVEIEKSFLKRVIEFSKESNPV